MAQGGLNVEEFVSEVIGQIISGVKAAQEAAEHSGAMINPRGQWLDNTVGYTYDTDYAAGSTQRIGQAVNFDIAVTVEQTDTTEGGVSIFVAPLFGGIKGKDELTNASVSRVRFKVPIFLPE